MSQGFFNFATLIGTILSLIGVIVAIVQIRKTRNAADSAHQASIDAKLLISRDVLLVDVTACTTSIEEVKTLIRHRRLEAALLRVTDLTAALIRLSHLPPKAQRPSSRDLKPVLTQLAILRELLESVNHDATEEFNPVHVNVLLSGISDQLNHWVGSSRFSNELGAS
jgi:hypothetical protein